MALAAGGRCSPHALRRISDRPRPGSVPGYCGHQYAGHVCDRGAGDSPFRRRRAGLAPVRPEFVRTGHGGDDGARPALGRFAGGAFAGILFTLIHGRDGLIDLGQRDLFVAVLVLAAYIFLFRYFRATEEGRECIGAVVLFGVCIGAAAAVKPTILPLGPALLALACLHRMKKGLPVVWLLVAGAVSLALPWGIAMGYLLHEHAASAFFTILLHLDSQHAQLRRQSSSYLLSHCISSVLLPMIAIWIPVALSTGFWRTWKGAALCIGVLAGFASFFLQGKGYAYHRYPSEVLLLLIVGIDCTAALKSADSRWPGTARLFAATALCYGVFVIGIGSAAKAIRFDWRDDAFDTMLQADLQQLGGQRLDGQVQCLDMAAGCLNVLYRMQLEQATGVLYDCYFFMPVDDPAVEKLRNRFWAEITEHPPRVFVVTSHQCGTSPMNYQYCELHQWPAFDGFLANNYSLYADRIPPLPAEWMGKPAPPFGYRIYVRDGARGYRAPIAPSDRGRYAADGRDSREGRAGPAA